MPTWQVLGEPPPAVVRSAREQAAELAREIGVSERAIADVLAEPMTPDREKWFTLWWADRMRRRDLDLVSTAPPAPAPAAPPAPAPAPRQEHQAPRRASGKR